MFTYTVEIDGQTIERKSSRLFTHAIVRRYSDGRAPEISLAGSEEKALAEASTQRRLGLKRIPGFAQVDVMPATIKQG